MSVEPSHVHTNVKIYFHSEIKLLRDVSLENNSEYVMNDSQSPEVRGKIPERLSVKTGEDFQTNATLPSAGLYSIYFWTINIQIMENTKYILKDVDFTGYQISIILLYQPVPCII